MVRFLTSRAFFQQTLLIPHYFPLLITLMSLRQNSITIFMKEEGWMYKQYMSFNRDRAKQARGVVFSRKSKNII